MNNSISDKILEWTYSLTSRCEIWTYRGGRAAAEPRRGLERQGQGE